MKDFLSALSNLQTESKIIKQQNIKLTEDVQLLNKRLNILEQKTLKNNIENVGVPEAKHENCVDIIKQIASKLQVQLSVL
jgi:hypothetical protein